MKVTQNALPRITVGNEPDPAATLGLIEMPVFHKMHRQMLRALEMLLEAGATIALSQPDRWGYLAISVHEAENRSYGYQIKTVVVVNGEPYTSHIYRNTPQAALRSALSFADGSNPFDWAEFTDGEA